MIYMFISVCFIILLFMSWLFLLPVNLIGVLDLLQNLKEILMIRGNGDLFVLSWAWMWPCALTDISFDVLIESVVPCISLFFFLVLRYIVTVVVCMPFYVSFYVCMFDVFCVFWCVYVFFRCWIQLILFQFFVVWVCDFCLICDACSFRGVCNGNINVSECNRWPTTDSFG